LRAIAGAFVSIVLFAAFPAAAGTDSWCTQWKNQQMCASVDDFRMFAKRTCLQAQARENLTVEESIALHRDREAAMIMVNRPASRDLGPRPWHSAGMPRVRISIVFESGARIGPGKAMLLASIRDTGSISAAARDMGMSYKRAWLLLDSINQAFTEPVVRAAPGGAGGGGATLTAFGAEVLERYQCIHDRAAAIAADDMAALGRRARPEAGPKI
jgi:molybdate transport system regulatory protein